MSCSVLSCCNQVNANGIFFDQRLIACHKSKVHFQTLNPNSNRRHFSIISPLFRSVHLRFNCQPYTSPTSADKPCGRSTSMRDPIESPSRAGPSPILQRLHFYPYLSRLIHFTLIFSSVMSTEYSDGITLCQQLPPPGSSAGLTGATIVRMLLVSFRELYELRT